MHAIMLQDDDNLSFEPLTSHIDICDLHIGDSSIINETIRNLWHSGISKIYLLVKVHEFPKYEKYDKRFNFSRKNAYIDVEVIGINVDVMDIGQALREFFTLKGTIESFVLLYMSTLLTVSLAEVIDLHHQRMKQYSKYTMSLIFTKDKDKSISDAKNSSMVVYDGNYELMCYGSNSDVLYLSEDYIKGYRNLELEVRYDLCRGDVYICTSHVIDYFVDLFDSNNMDEYISHVLTQDIKTMEVYVTLLRNDIGFPSYPSVVRVTTPRIYYNVYMCYISRFEKIRTTSSRPRDASLSPFGPIIRSTSSFTENSAISGKCESPDSFTNSIVGMDVKTGRDTRVINSIIFDDVEIGSNCEIKNSIIMNNVIVLDGSRIPSGSIIGSYCCIKPSDLSTGIPFKCAKFKSRFIDLTVDVELDANWLKDGDLWPIEAFFDQSLNLNAINDNFYTHFKFKIPDPDEEESVLDYNTDAFTDSEEDIRSLSPTLQSCTSFEDFSAELNTMVRECLEFPNLMDHKLLEIRSLRTAHNVPDVKTLKLLYSYGLKWIVKHDIEDICDLIDRSRFADLLGSFNCAVPNEYYFDETLKVCKSLDKSLLYFCNICEALYHTEVIDFEGFQQWINTQDITEPRLLAFAEWLTSD